jgi:predicted amino acid-binding ACT domain protein
MTVRRRLRVELPDRPGALARVAALLAAHGADVMSVDIHELDQGRAVDEIIVDVGDDWDLAEFSDELRREGAGVVLAATASGPGGDRVVAALHWARHLVEIGVQHSEFELSSTIAQLCPGATAWVGSIDEGALDPLGAEALERGGPIVREVDEIPRRLANDAACRGWLLAVPDDPERPRRLALVARPIDLRFSATEVARIEALLGLAYELSFAR